MRTAFVENLESSQRVYSTILLNAQHLGILSSDLAMKIIGEIAKEPMCAMDIAKNLKEREQKIYYHLKRMKEAGIVKLTRTELRYGMSAKIFDLTSPVVSAKLKESYDEGDFRLGANPEVREFLDPFVKNGILNSVIVMGDPYPHGPHDTGARDGSHILDLGLLIGKSLNRLDFLKYVFDTQIDSSSLKENLILFGEPKANLIINELNEHLPIYFDYEKGYKIISRKSNESYDAPRIGVIMKIVSPWNKNKKVLVISGIGVRGVSASVIAATQHIQDLLKKYDSTKCFAAIVEGLDKDGDGSIDEIRFLE